MSGPGEAGGLEERLARLPVGGGGGGGGGWGYKQ